MTQGMVETEMRAGNSPAPRNLPAFESGSDHLVQFYDDADFLTARVAAFVADGFASGEPAIVIASSAHRQAVRRQLELRELDVDHLEAAHRLLWLDAAETLTRFMAGGRPNPARFQMVIGEAIDQLTNANPGTRFRAYGEMVDLLCRDGNKQGALRLEELWSGLATRRSFALLCGYSMDGFTTAGDTADFQHVCSAHTHVFSTNYAQPDLADGTHREIARLQQRARALEAELEYRKDLEKELRRSQTELAEFCENAAEGIHRVAADGTILWANKAELDLLGYERDEYIGHHIAEFHVDEEKIQDILERLGKNQTLLNCEARLRCKDGSLKHVVITSNVYRENDEFIHTRCFTRDVTAQKRAEDSLRFLVDAGAVIASSLDYEATLKTVARMCVPRLADWALIDIVVDGSSKRIAVAHLDSEIRDADLVESISDIPTLEIVRRLGLRSSMCVPLTAGAETIGAITLVAAESGRQFTQADLTLAQELARQASVAIRHARLYEEAQTAVRMKDEFLATVSHELRTPLSAILGWARILRSGGVAPEKVERALDAIERNSVSQVQLIEDLLDVSRVISGKLRLDIQPLDLRPVVEAAVDTMLPVLTAKDIHFQQLIDPNAAPISGDPHRIQQVIWNLLSNAVKFTPKGGTVQLTVERADSSVNLMVSDTGQGIAQHLLPTIFDRFKQADGSTVRVHGGLGLGLAIVRHIVELHGGKVEAHSDGEGRGSLFSVRLPLAPLAQDTTGPFRQRALSNAKPQFERPAELQGLTVLIVEDDKDTREVLTEVLQQCGSSVLTASSAEEGLAVLDGASPRVVVCDIGMAGTDGYRFIEQVRQRPPENGGHIVALALTAFATAEDRRRALHAGFQMHMAKPVEPAVFVAALADLAQLAIAMA
jgi:PAS domain S-box-containing protein